MKRLLSTIVIMSGIGLAPTSLFAGAPIQEAPSLQDRAIEFLQKKVIDRTQKIESEGTLTADGQDYNVKFSAIIKWSNLKRTESGLTFEQSREIHQINTKIDKNGKLLAEPVNVDRVVVMQYAVAERETTKSLVGLATMLKNTQDDPTGIGFVAMLELSNDGKELYLYESQAGFSERSLDGKTVIPAASASEATLFLDVNGKLEMDETVKFYKVDVNKDFAREEMDRFNLTANEVAP